MSFFPVLWFLGVECLDELVDGLTGAAWPAIKGDLHLSLAQIGLLLGVPRLVGNIIELPLGIMADITPRCRLIAGGGLAFTLAAVLICVAPSFSVLMIALLLFHPASGAFVSISQASLMDIAPHQRELNMARWSLAGSLGNLAGPLLFSAAIALGFGWRPVYGLIATLALAIVALMLGVKRTAKTPLFTPQSADEASDPTVTEIITKAWRGGALRWLVLLESSDLMLDVFRGYLALYLVEVALTSQAFAGLAVVVLTGASLMGGVLMVPLLSRMTGLTWLRFSSLSALAVFPVFYL